MTSQNVLIVGANRGIGLGFVQQLLPTAGQIYATYRSQASSELADLAARSEQLHLIPMDITDETQIASGLAEIRQQVERLHLVVYSAGFLHEGEIQPEKSLQQIQPDHLLRYFQVNSLGAVLLAKHLIPLLKHPERSVLACISAKIGSIADNQSGGWYGYRASKAALNMLMRTAALEYSRKSPQTIVALLHPGTTDTQLSQPFQRGVPSDKLFSVERTVSQLLSVIDELEPEQSGEFLSWDGSQISF